MQLIEVLQCPPDLYQLFAKYAKSYTKHVTLYEKYAEKCMSEQEFSEFLYDVQKEEVKQHSDSITFESRSTSLKHTPKQPNSSPLSTNLSFIDFCHYLLSVSKNPAISP